jgi:S-adenosylhomocysteine hydrolase
MKFRRDEIASATHNRRITMKTLFTVLTLTTLIAGVTAANADQQATDDAVENALSHRMATPSAYASARTPVGHVKVNGTGYHFRLQGR